MKKWSKGFSLIELLVALLVIAIVSTLVTTLLVYGYESFNTYSRYTGQQEKIQQTLRLIGKDIQACRKITYATNGALTLNYIELEIPDVGTRRWSITGGALQCTSFTGGTTVTGISVDGLEMSGSKIMLDQSTFEMLVVSVMPVATNTGKYSGNNIKEPITTEFSVKYKDITEAAIAAGP